MAYQNKNLKHNNVSNKKPQHNDIVPETKTIFLLPIIFVIAVLPFIVKLHDYSTPLAQYAWFTENDRYFDFFLYYKQSFLISAFVVMLVFILFKAYTDKKSIRFSSIFVPLGVYAVLALLSSIVSEYRSYSFSGIFEQFESVFVLLGYCCIVYYAYLFIQSERDLRYIIYALLISVIIFGLIGLSQVSGNDFFNTQTGWSLISNTTYRDYKDEFDFVAGVNRVYLSFYNPNYVGVYVSLILPIMFFMIIFTKKLWLRIIFLLGFIGLAISLYGSKSTAGFVGVTVSIVLSVVLLWRYILKYLYISIPVIILVTIAMFIINIKYDNYIINQINKITNIQKSSPTLTEIQTNDDDLVIKYNGNTLRVMFNVDEYGICNFIFVDDNNMIVPFFLDTVNGPVTITDQRFSGFVFTPTMFDDIIGFEIPINGIVWAFTNQTEDHTYYYLNSYGRYIKMISAPSAVFTGYEQYASGRGYIWSRTIPILKDKILLGSGADTFTLVFPQQDYVNSYNYGFGNQLMSKPHSLFLQMAVQTGVISLLAFLVFYCIYFISSFGLYINGKFDSQYSIIGAAIFVGTFGYMVSGITNDSSITVAPVFWALIGVGIAINSKYKQLMKQASVVTK